jgi:hypothetical protein
MFATVDRSMLGVSDAALAATLDATARGGG